MCRLKQLFGIGSVANLRRLFDSWRIPATGYYRNHRIVGEESFLITLKRLKYPCKLSDLVTEFGGDVATISMNINFMFDYVDANLKKLIYKSIDSWVHCFPMFAAAIQRKLITLGCEWLVGDELRIIGFIDNTIFATCAPGTGPINPGIGAQRKDPIFQQSFYTGWKHLHGVKIQFVTFPSK